MITRYQSWIRRPSDIVSPGDRSISYTNARLARAFLASTDRTHIPSIIILEMVIQKAQIYGQSSTGHCRTFQHTLFDLYLPTQHPPYSRQRQQLLGERASWMADTAMPFPLLRHVWSTDVGYRRVSCCLNCQG